MDFNCVLKFLVLMTALWTIGCGPNEAILRSNTNQAAAEPTGVANTRPDYDTVESEVENMRTADFDFIFVLRRKDGGVMQADDKSFVRTNTPNANRRSLVDGGKAIVIGANAGALGDVVKKLSDRFDLQDFSRSSAKSGNSNSIVNANIGH